MKSINLLNITKEFMVHITENIIKKNLNYGGITMSIIDKKTATIKYLLNEKGRKNSLLNSGNGKELQSIEAEVSERLLKYAPVSQNGEVTLYIGFELKYSNIKGIIIDYKVACDELGDYIQEIYDKNYFDRVMTVDELLSWEEKRISKLEKLKDKYKDIMEEREKKLKEKELLKQEEEQKQQEEKERKRAKEEQDKLVLAEEKKKKEKAFIEERNKWITQDGSQYLKDAIELGYKINRKYVFERASKELGKFKVDIDDKAYWQEKCNPSENALVEVKGLIEEGYNAEIVWLTDAVEDANEKDEYYDEPFEPCEAIVIFDYLGKYNLVKEI